MRNNQPITQNEYPFPETMLLVSETDTSGNIIKCNDSFELISGFSRDELIGSPHNMVRHPDVPSEVFKDMWQTLQKGLPWSQVIKNRRQNGDYYWVRANVTPTYDESGELKGFLSVREAVSEADKKQAEALYGDLSNGKKTLHHGDVETPATKFKHLVSMLGLPNQLVLIILLFAILPMWISHQAFDYNAIAMLTGISVLVLFLSYLLGNVLKRRMEGVVASLRQLSGGKPKLNVTISSSFTGRIRAAAQSAALAIGAYRSDLDSETDRANQLHLAVDQAWTNMMMLDAQGRVQYINQKLTEYFVQHADKIAKQIENFNPDEIMGKPYSYFFDTESSICLDEPKEQKFYLGELFIHWKCVPIKNRVNVQVGTVIEWFDKTNENLLLQEVGKINDGILAGDLNYRVDLNKADDSIKPIVKALNETLDSIIRSIDMSSNVAIGMSVGNFQQDINQTCPGYFGVVKEALNVSMENISDILSSVQEVSDYIDSDSQRVRQASLQLSESSQKQAAAIEQTSASMEEITSTVESNSDNAIRASRQADEAAHKAQSGVQVMSQALESMETINLASEKIGNIIGLIDTIAFQTNLLALNAAVEAARAGEHGRGFAVVAGEVRTLASKSADAAKDIRGLIEDTLQKVKQGTEYVSHSSESLEEIKQAIEETSQVVADIRKSSEEQSLGINQINQAIANIDTGVQQNAAMAEETSKLAEQLSVLAAAMNRNADTFQIKQKQHKAAINSETNFVRIRMAHRQWRAKARALVYGFEVGIDPAKAIDPRGCELGQWIYGQGQMYLHDEMFQQLEQMHSEMHAQIGRVISYQQIGDSQSAEKGLFRLEELSDSVVKTISTLEDKIAND